MRDTAPLSHAVQTVRLRRNGCCGRRMKSDASNQMAAEIWSRERRKSSLEAVPGVPAARLALQPVPSDVGLLPATILLAAFSLNSRLYFLCFFRDIRRSPFENCPSVYLSHFWGALHRFALELRATAAGILSLLTGLSFYRTSQSLRTWFLDVT
jgi:hypothetical protein